MPEMISATGRANCSVSEEGGKKMFYAVDQWDIIVRTFDDRADAEEYITRNPTLHIVEGE